MEFSTSHPPLNPLTSPAHLSRVYCDWNIYAGDILVYTTNYIILTLTIYSSNFKQIRYTLNNTLLFTGNQGTLNFFWLHILHKQGQTLLYIIIKLYCFSIYNERHSAKLFTFIIKCVNYTYLPITVKLFMNSLFSRCGTQKFCLLDKKANTTITTALAGHPALPPIIPSRRLHTINLFVG